MKRRLANQLAEKMLGREVHSDYVAGRRSAQILSYGAARRAREVIACLRSSEFPSRGVLLDVGSADGLVLRAIHEAFPDSSCSGIDIEPEYVAAAQSAGLDVTLGDAHCLSAPDGSLDAVTATAVLKHLPRPDRFLTEVARVLKCGGVTVLIDPTPFAVAVGSILGYFLPGTIAKPVGMGQMRTLLRRVGLVPQEERRFMLSPLPLSGLESLEGMVRRVGLSILLLNQTISARKPF